MYTVYSFRSSFSLPFYITFPFFQKENNKSEKDEYPHTLPKMSYFSFEPLWGRKKIQTKKENNAHCEYEMKKIFTPNETARKMKKLKRNGK